MEITLLINGEEKTFKAHFISARKLKEAFSLTEKAQEGLDRKFLDDTSKFMVDIYGNQFTEDELLDGYDATKFFEKVLKDLQYILAGFSEKTKN